MPTLKQCRHLSVVRMFACALLLLSPLTYFLDFGLTAGVTAATAVRGPASGSSPAGGSEVTRGTASLAADRAKAVEERRDSALEEESRRRRLMRRVKEGTDRTAAVEERRDSALEEESRRRRVMRRVKEGTDRTAAVEERRDSALEEESRRRRLMRRVKEGTDRAKAGEAGKPSWPKVQFQQWGADMPGMRIRRLQRPDWMNNLKVLYKGQRRPQQQPKEVLCALKTKAQVQTLDGTEEPFSKLGWANLVPPRPLDRLEGSEFKSCAVVSSAASILRSSLGKEIDSHDAVLRFNAAPIKGFEADVGTKTTIRLINSQVMTRPELFFNTSPLYQNVTLVAWDPPPYSLDLNTWYQNPDYNLFGPYARRRRLQPQQPFYVLHPRFIWHLWDIVQGNTLVDIQPNPPSSGFIGIVLMMALCQEVHVYEYVPSMRQTARCHYYEKYVDTACTHGAYHPLRYEKSLVRKVNAGGRSDLMSKGRVTLPGFSTIDCGS